MQASGSHELADGEPVAATAIPSALTSATINYTDGSSQVFTSDGHTVYTDRGQPTLGEWGVNDDGRFWSFWPPNYRATYDLQWIVDAGRAVGIRFIQLGHDSTFDGHYATPGPMQQGSV